MIVKIDKRYGCFTIKNEASLADTANKLGKIFEVEFELDDSGKYEEIPAYCASSKLYNFILFGFPEPEFDLRDEDERATGSGLTFHTLCFTFVV